MFESSSTASIKDIIQVLTDSALSLTVRLGRSLHIILKIIKAQGGSIMLLNKEKNGLQVAAATNPDIMGFVQSIHLGSISGYVFQNSTPLLIEDINKSYRFRPNKNRTSYRTDSLLCVPLLDSHQNSMGVINCSDRENDSCFTEEDCLLLQEYAALISPLVENSCLMDSLAHEKERYKSLYQELELKQKELLITHTERSELVEMVVHDFKSPLSAIISNLDLLSYTGLNQDQEKTLHTARNGASSLLEMINEFLEVARLDQWQEKKGRLLPVNITPVAKQVLEEAGPTAATKGVNLCLDIENDAAVIADQGLLHHLLSNLISNAIKYSPESGVVNIFWEILHGKRSEDRDQNLVKICIQDMGPGVPDELKQKIFERFSRADRDKDIQGTGVGLFICNRIITILEGRIWVQDAPGGGSIFCVTMYSSRGEADA